MSRPVRWIVSFATFLQQFPEFLADSWRGWRSIVAAALGEEPEDRGFVLQVSARSKLLGRLVRALHVVAGRGSGKTRFFALLAVYFGVGREYVIAPGELLYICIYAPTKRQSHIAFRYILGLLRSVPSFAAMIVRETTDTVELDNGIVIETGVPDYRTVRGRSIVLAIVDEGAFLPTDESATPDTELLRALRPALARVPGSLLVFDGTAYAQRGELYRGIELHHGKDDSETLAIKATTQQLNPLFDTRAIEEAFQDDPASADAEYGSNFRRDVEDAFTRDAIEACKVPGRFELPRVSGVKYHAFLDFAGGSGKDAATLAIAHLDERTGRATLDLVMERRPPFSPEDTCTDFASTIRTYGLAEATADRWGGQFPVEAMQKLGVRVTVSERTKSEIYKEALALVNSQRVALLDHARLLAQLAALERRTARGGKDSIDHPPGGHDDLANAAAGALMLAAEKPEVSVAVIRVGETFPTVRRDAPMTEAERKLHRRCHESVHGKPGDWQWRYFRH